MSLLGREFLKVCAPQGGSSGGGPPAVNTVFLFPLQGDFADLAGNCTITPYGTLGENYQWSSLAGYAFSNIAAPLPSAWYQAMDGFAGFRVDNAEVVRTLLQSAEDWTLEFFMLTESYSNVYAPYVIWNPAASYSYCTGLSARSGTQISRWVTYNSPTSKSLGFVNISGILANYISHFALERAGNYVRTYMNGALVDTLSLPAGWTGQYNAAGIFVFDNPLLTSQWSTGHLNSLKLSRVARYRGANFTPTFDLTID